MVSERASQRAFFGVSALLFAASAAVTILWCASMSAMGRCPCPAAGRCRCVDADARTDVARHRGVVPRHVVAMMVAMMLPSLSRAAALREAVGKTGEARLGRLTVLVGVRTSSSDRVRMAAFRSASRWRRSKCRSGLAGAVPITAVWSS